MKMKIWKKISFNWLEHSFFLKQEESDIIPCHNGYLFWEQLHSELLTSRGDFRLSSRVGSALLHTSYFILKSGVFEGEVDPQLVWQMSDYISSEDFKKKGWATFHHEAFVEDDLQKTTFKSLQKRIIQIIAGKEFKKDKKPRPEGVGLFVKMQLQAEALRVYREEHPRWSYTIDLIEALQNGFSVISCYVGGVDRSGECREEALNRILQCVDKLQERGPLPASYEEAINLISTNCHSRRGVRRKDGERSTTEDRYRAGSEFLPELLKKLDASLPRNFLKDLGSTLGDRGNLELQIEYLLKQAIECTSILRNGI